MTGGLRSILPRVAVFTLITLSAAGCDSVPAELRPPEVLRDSLGLGDSDAVYEIGLAVSAEIEGATPQSVRMDRPGWLSFRSDDPRARRVVLDTAGLTVDQRAWASTRRGESPPLIHAEARWVVDFREAPAGSWTFRIVGSAREGSVRVEVPVRD